MPEGHTIHRLARRQLTLFGGQQLAVSSPQGRFAAGAARIDGLRLARIDAYGKHLFYRFEDDQRLHVHLGLYGKFADGDLPAPPERGALRLRLVGDRTWADLRGPTACELLTPAEQAGIEARLGPDPLRTGARPDAAWARISRSRAPIGALLMDQSVLAGVGNVYRAEILFLFGLSPFRPGRDVPADVFGQLWLELRRLMQAGVRSGRIVTTDPADRSRRRGPALAADAHYVYRRAGLPCRRCGSEVRSAPMVGRTVFWCPQDQPD